MCSNFEASQPAKLLADLGLGAPMFAYPSQVWPGSSAPIVVGAGAGHSWLPAMFGLVPVWAESSKLSRHTYNARSETVDTKPSYRGAWQRGQLALVPMDRFYEPSYASGRAVRWQIQRQDLAAFTVAALWDVCPPNATNSLSEPLYSFSMLTINADGHAVMGAFHRPEDEKRSLVVVPPKHRSDWLTATPSQARELLQAMPADEFCSQAAPLEVKRKPTKPIAKVNASRDLFTDL